MRGRRPCVRPEGATFACISRDWRSTGSCNRCRGRHNSVCPRRSESTTNPSTISPGPIPGGGGQASGSIHGPTNVAYVDLRTPILLQTARLRLYNPSNTVVPPLCVEARAIMDSGSQRTYITSRLRDSLHLSTTQTESLHIRTFGSTEECDTTCEAVDLGLVTKGGETLKLTALVVPLISNPLTSQPINYGRDHCDHLLEIDLAHSADVGDILEVDVLIGSDFYWSLITGRVRRRRNGPMAVSYKGWMDSFWAGTRSQCLTLASTHTLRIDTHPVEQNLDDQLRRFWELESLGITRDEPSVTNLSSRFRSMENSIK